MSKSEFAICSRLGCDIADRVIASKHDAKKTSAKQNRVSVTRHEVSDIGTRIRTAIETAADFKMKCGHLLSYLRTLNQRTTHDAAEIVSRMLVELELPSACRAKIGSIENQRTWLESIVAEALQ